METIITLETEDLKVQLVETGVIIGAGGKEVALNTEQMNVLVSFITDNIVFPAPTGVRMPTGMRFD
ncbi:hypothetical protein LCGC14_2830810 [marine sediment metagenome]|uniref:Uncharacterized protein n=1 Tax=marine sediment metagenome TaxID=412755 RepID=A0A0F8Z0U5_9ZZZZ